MILAYVSLPQVKVTLYYRRNEFRYAPWHDQKRWLPRTPLSAATFCEILILLFFGRRNASRFKWSSSD